jgi:hypothetical protein
MKFRALVAGLAMLLVLGMVGNGNAITINGALWTPADASAKDPSILPSVATNVTFTVNDINFDSRRGTRTYDSFLKGSTTGNPNGLSWGNSSWSVTDGADTYDKDSFYTSRKHGTFFQFWGFAWISSNLSIVHDDGFYLTLTPADKNGHDIGAQGVFDFSKPTTPELTSLGNAAGYYNFVLNYGAWNGFPEVLDVIGKPFSDHPHPVPEPSTMLFLGCGLAGLAFYRRKRDRS